LTSYVVYVTVMVYL